MLQQVKAALAKQGLERERAVALRGRCAPSCACHMDALIPGHYSGNMQSPQPVARALHRLAQKSRMLDQLYATMKDLAAKFEAQKEASEQCQYRLGACFGVARQP